MKATLIQLLTRKNCVIAGSVAVWLDALYRTTWTVDTAAVAVAERKYPTASTQIKHAMDVVTQSASNRDTDEVLARIKCVLVYSMATHGTHTHIIPKQHAIGTVRSVSSSHTPPRDESWCQASGMMLSDTTDAQMVYVVMESNTKRIKAPHTGHITEQSSSTAVSMVGEAWTFSLKFAAHCDMRLNSVQLHILIFRPTPEK